MKKLLLSAFAALLLVAFTVPAMAATNAATFYGNVRYWNWIVKQDDNFKLNPTNYDDTDLVWGADIYDNRFGVRLQEGNIKANIEIRPFSASYFRQFWASYTFGNTEMLIGFTWSPFFCPVTTSIYSAGGLQGDWGDMASCLRSDMIGFKTNLGFGHLFLALEPPKTGSIDGTTTTSNVLDSGGDVIGTTTVDEVKDYDTFLPRIEANFTFNAGPANVGVFGGYNTYKIVDSMDNSETIKSYIYGARLEVPVGPVSLRGILWKAQNMGNYGYAFGGTEPSSITKALYVNDEVKDASTLGFAAAATFRITDMVSVDAGYGHAKYERYKDEEAAGAFYYVRFPITIAKGFTVTPEVGRLALKDSTDAAGNDTTQGNETWYGLYWQINF